MEKYKVERIAGLTNEVKDLHPLLAALFPKLPGIIDADYRQGVNEKGTDFVLTKRDETLNTESYIGVVVKSGGIRQAMDDVVRQIDECEMERFVQSGKKRIFVDEIWVVTNDSISHNAQEKIHHKYRNKSIRFVDIQKLIFLIDRHYPEYWRVESIEVSEYFSKAKVLISEMLSKCNLPAQDAQSIYIPPNLRLVEADSKKKKENTSWKARLVSPEKIMASEDRVVLIEGEMGMGKTRLILKLAEELCVPELFRENKLLPVVVSFSDLCDKYDAKIDAYVSKIRKDHGFGESEIKFVVFVDGIDEKKCSNNERIELIRACIASSNCDGVKKVIFSSRTNDDTEYETKLGKIVVRYRIAPLSIKQLISYIEKLCPEVGVREKFQRELERSNLIKVLPRTPISAILLGRLMREKSSEIPSTLTELYLKYTELVLGRWDMSKGLQSQTEYDVISALASKVSKFMMENAIVRLPLGDAEAMLEDYASSRNLKINVQETFRKFCEKAEIFYIDDNCGTLSFRHRTFSEFFYARQFDELNPAEIDEKIYDLYWENVYFFLFGLKRDCAPLVSALIKFPVQGEYNRLMRALHNPKLLLAAYLTPYNEIEEVIKFGIKELATIFYDGLVRSQDSSLAELPPMVALFVLTQGVLQTTSYEFFKRCLDDYWLELATINNPSDRDFVEMYFVCVARMPFEKENVFDEMIKQYEKSLPMVIKLGIHHCSEDFGKGSAVIKRYVKKLRKLFSSSTNKEMIRALYQDSLKSKAQKNTKLLTAKS